MGLRQLRYFVAVAEERNFTAAAQRLNISQPPLSMQIKALEEALGVHLFDRTHRRVRLTEAGAVFLEQARLTLGQLDSAVQLTKLAVQGGTGLLRVAFTGSVPLVPGFATLVRTFREGFPHARLHIEHMPTGPQLQALEERHIDVGLLRPAPQFQPPPHLQLTPFWRDELRVVVPTDHFLAKRKGRIAIEDLAAEPLILFPRDISCGLHDQTMQLFNKAGLVPRIGQVAREGTAIVGLVAAGVGISLLPDAYARLRTEGVLYKRLQADATNCPLFLAHRRDQPGSLTQRFIKLAQSLIAGKAARR
ncbi:LysR family transcriptional regulator [Candidimonas nitroreducens]|uniref:LysR family transcriptional regulator n=1 Tax=Candidimonas nitroreducens TaxID=683354 RepID=A0A225M8G7_9BURK|nr:LysR family transcriptional regulator [Candidimonas nitroreducens]OWT57568.1 LysR family transcriptional regulator [Candidimonas nitroreducens]